MKHRIYPRIVTGDANEVTTNEILWIEHEDGTVDLQKRNASGKLVSIVSNEGTPVATSIDEPETITENILD